MNIESINKILDSLAAEEFIFTNEQDFQFVFAKALSKLPEVEDVKLEVLSLPITWDEVRTTAERGEKIGRENKEYTDIIVETKSEGYIAIELKYKTPDKMCYYETKNGPVVTMAQGAHDINAYAFIEDISRLEKINDRHFCNDIKISKGYAIILTNNKNYRCNDFSRSRIWNNYAINNGHTIPNTQLTFGKIEDGRIVEKTEYRTNSTEFNAITLNNEYLLEWHDYKLESYSDYSDNERSYHPGFSYLVVEVWPR